MQMTFLSKYHPCDANVRKQVAPRQGERAHISSRKDELPHIRIHGWPEGVGDAVGADAD
jgi:hypothetical protein